MHLNHQASTQPSPRLNRHQQLTLNTWRLAAAKLEREVPAIAVLEQAAVHAVLAALRDVPTPVALFVRHAHALPEFELIRSLVEEKPREQDLTFDVLDTGFLLRWNELVADGSGPEELPPLRRQPVSCDAGGGRIG
jgi:hypothetical protein